MRSIGILVLAAVSIGAAAPALSQDRPYYSYPAASGPRDGTSFADRLADYRQLLAKKASEDGGALTAAHKAMLNRRLERMIAEERSRQNPIWPGITG